MGTVARLFSQNYHVVELKQPSLVKSTVKRVKFFKASTKVIQIFPDKKS